MSLFNYYKPALDILMLNLNYIVRNQWTRNDFIIVITIEWFYTIFI